MSKRDSGLFDLLEDFLWGVTDFCVTADGPFSDLLGVTTDFEGDGLAGELAATRCNRPPTVFFGEGTPIMFGIITSESVGSIWKQQWFLVYEHWC